MDAPEEALRRALALEAEALARLARFKEARAVVRDLTRLWEDDAPVNSLDSELEAQARFVLGLLAHQDGDPKQAARQCGRAEGNTGIRPI